MDCCGDVSLVRGRCRSGFHESKLAGFCRAFLIRLRSNRSLECLRLPTLFPHGVGHGHLLPKEAKLGPIKESGPDWKFVYTGNAACPAGSCVCLKTSFGGTEDCGATTRSQCWQLFSALNSRSPPAVWWLRPSR